MSSRRRPVKSIYGRSKLTKTSEVLWNEAVAASPIARQTMKEMTCTSPGKENYSATASPTKNNNKDSESSAREILGTADPNCHLLEEQPPISGTGPLDVHVDFPDHCQPALSRISDGMSVTEASLHGPRIDGFPQLTSTPIRSLASEKFLRQTGTHTRFDSSRGSVSTSTPIQTSSAMHDIDDSFSDLSSLDSLADLTDVFGALTTSQTLVSVHEESKQDDVDQKQLLGIANLLELCQQQCAEDFTHFIQTLLIQSSVKKLGEASFSEVFLGTTKSQKEQTVYKVIPFGEGAEEVPINDIIQELRISRAMSEVPGYVEVKHAVIVRGTYPVALLDAWDIWHEERQSESDRPDWYKSTQLYCILALEHGGTDLEHYELKSWTAANAIFANIVKALALGEDQREFEHRDLHWGNVLVKESAENEEMQITIVDYTLSRALVRDELSELAYYSFQDRAIFEADGDDYQFEIYRLMRDIITSNEEEEGEQLVTENWALFRPATNVLWLHYLLDKLLHAKGLARPAMRRSKRNPVLNENEIQAWKSLDTCWKLLNPERRYGEHELPIESASRVWYLYTSEAD